MRIVGVASLMVLPLAIASCGGGSGSSGSVSLGDFPARVAAAQCARVFRCCTVPQIQALYGTSVTTASACTAELTALGQALVTSITSEQSAGRLRYDGVAAATCFQKLGTAACTDTSNEQSVVPECDAYLVPQVATGGACSGDEECQTGFCDRPLASSADGSCAVVPTKGMPCTSRCATGATCDTVRGMCVDPKADGSFCFVDEDCVSGFCDNPNITGGTCAPSPGPTCGPAA